MVQSVFHLDRVKVLDLRPTQVTVGMREVTEKQAEWEQLSKPDREKYLEGHVVPAVLGPTARHFIVDHHHIARALLDEGRKHVWVAPVEDFSHLAEDEFWSVMDHRSLVHPFDRRGRRVGYRQIPKSLLDLADDPFRSLAGEVRRLGGFAKIPEPYVEFVWADFFRIRISSKVVTSDFDAALLEALMLAHSTAAQHLPGWCTPSAGPSPAASR
jgi:hypothetical protein